MPSACQEQRATGAFVPLVWAAQGRGNGSKSGSGSPRATGAQRPAELGGDSPVWGRPASGTRQPCRGVGESWSGLFGWVEGGCSGYTIGQASRKEDSAPGRESSLGKGPGAGPTLVCVWGPGSQMLPGQALQEIGLDSEKVAGTFLLPTHGRAGCRLCPPAQLAGHLCGRCRQRPGPSRPSRRQAVLTLAPSPQPSWHVAAQPASRPLGTISCLFLPSLGRAWG